MSSGGAALRADVATPVASVAAPAQVRPASLPWKRTAATTRSSTPGRYVLASAALHAVLFAAAAVFAPRGGTAPVPAEVRSEWQAPVAELAPQPELPPDAPPVPDRPADALADTSEPVPLEVAWDATDRPAIAVATVGADRYRDSARWKPRVRGIPGGSGASGVAASPAPAREPPAASVEPPEPAPVERTFAQPVATPHPVYPERARDAGIEGTVVLEVDVAADGSVAEVRVLRSSGSRALDNAAIDAARRWRFDPATVGGVAVVSTVRLPDIRFHLDR